MNLIKTYWHIFFVGIIVLILPWVCFSLAFVFSVFLTLLTVGSVRKPSLSWTLGVPCVIKKVCLHDTAKNNFSNVAFRRQWHFSFKITEPNGLSFVQKRKTHVKFIYSRWIFEACLKVARSYHWFYVHFYLVAVFFFKFKIKINF